MRPLPALLVVVAVALAVTLAIGSAPARAAPAAEKAPRARPRALILEMRGDAVSPETRKAVTGVVTVELARDARLDVVSGDDVRNMAQLEAERQEAGCDDSCLAEIAGAMNAELVVTGFVGKLGSLTVVTLSLFDARKAQAVGRATVEVRSLDELPRKLPGALNELLSAVPKPVSPALAYSLLGAGGGGAAIGVVGVIVGAALFANTDATLRALDERAGEFDDPDDVDGLTDAHDQHVNAIDAYNEIGVPALWGGALLVVAGATVAGVGAVLLAGASE